MNYINHSCTDRRLRLELFCLSAPSQLLHADPHFTLAASWWRVGGRGGRGDEKGKRAAESVKRIGDKVMRVKKNGTQEKREM